MTTGFRIRSLQKLDNWVDTPNPYSVFQKNQLPL